MGFHSMEYLEILRQAGIPDAQAEAQIEVLSKIVESEITSKQDLETLKKEIASKQDLKSMENRILIKFGALIFFLFFPIGILIMVGLLKSGIL